jgi:hypothetical protein
LFVLKEVDAVAAVGRNETIAVLEAVDGDLFLVKLEPRFPIVMSEAQVALPDQTITTITSRLRQLGSFFWWTRIN